MSHKKQSHKNLIKTRTKTLIKTLRKTNDQPAQPTARTARRPVSQKNIAIIPRDFPVPVLVGCRRLSIYHPHRRLLATLMQPL